MQQQGNQQMDAMHMFAAARCRASDAQFQQFVRGLAAVMNQWTALHLVAQHIDANAFQDLYQDLVDWHQQSGEVYSDEMELFFEDFFGSVRSVIIEDDSMKEVSDVLHDMYCRCCKDDFSRVEHFVSTEVIYRRENPVAMCVNGSSADNDAEEEGLGGLTMAEAEAALSNGDDGLYHGDERDGDGEGEGVEGNEEEEAPAQSQQQQQQQQQQPPKNRRKKKNAAVKGSNGWSVVL